MWEPADRMKEIGPNKIREMEKKVKPSTIRFDIGDPGDGIVPPKCVIRAFKKALDDGRTKYCPAAGLPELREAIAEQYSNIFERKVTPGMVVVSLGSEGAICSSVLAYVNRGDKVLHTDPGFPNHKGTIYMAEGIPIPINLMDKKNFSLNLDKLEKTIRLSRPRKPKMAILNWPNNPTGTMEREDNIAEAIKICKKNGVIVLSDEVYDRIVFDGTHIPLGRLSEDVITANSFSKTYAATGLRVGYGIFPSEEDAETVSRVQNIKAACPPTPNQLGVLAALKNPKKSEDYLKAVVEEYRKRRDALAEELNSVDGFECTKPPATFYVFPRTEETGYTSQQLSNMLVEKADVTAVDGNVFGVNGNNHLRFSYSKTPVEKIRLAGERIRVAMESRQ